MIILPGGLVHLLAQEMENRQDLRARFVRVNLHVVADVVGREEPINRAGGQQFLTDYVLEQFLRVIEKLSCFAANLRVLKNAGVPPAQFPRMKERRPINEGNDLG